MIIIMLIKFNSFGEKKGGLDWEKKEKEGAKMELRRNGTINTPFILSPVAGWTTLKKGGNFRFSFIKPTRKHLS
jgi:hypothetical protein